MLIPVLLIYLLQLTLVLYPQRKELKRHIPKNNIICAVLTLLSKSVCSINNAIKRTLDLLMNYSSSKHQIRSISQRPLLSTKNHQKPLTIIIRTNSKKFLLKDKYFIFAIYMFRLIKLNFKSYIKKQKATHEIAKRLFDDSVKYNSNSFIDERNNTITINKNGSHFLQKITSRLALARKE